MFKFRMIVGVVLGVCAGCTAVRAQTVDSIDPAMKARVDAIAAGVMEQRGVPSASLAVVQGGKLVYTRAYGRAHIDPDKAATPRCGTRLGRSRSSLQLRRF